MHALKHTVKEGWRKKFGRKDLQEEVTPPAVPAKSTVGNSNSNSSEETPYGEFKVFVPSYEELETKEDDPKKKKTYVVYNILISRSKNKPGGFINHSIQRRFNEFRQFDKGWRAVYPGLHDSIALPVSVLLCILFEKLNHLDNQKVY